MTSLTPSNTERALFVERTLASTIETLSDPDVDRVLNGSATAFLRDLQSAEIVEVHDGVVQEPQNKAAAFAIVAAQHGEVLKMHEHYFRQTETQRTLTLQAMAQWEPRYNIEALYEAVVPNDNPPLETRPEVVLARKSLAMVGTSIALLSEHQGKDDYFFSSPDGILLFRHKPTLIVGLDDTIPTAATMVHELAHIAKANYYPVIVAKSQHSLDMFSLEEELEASGAGGPVALTQMKKQGDLTTDDIMQHPDFLQIALDDLRRRYAVEYGPVNPRSPFRPSGMLLKMVRENGLGNTLHETLDFEAIERCARSE